MGPRNVNSKVEAGRAKKAAVEAEKSAKAAAVREAQETRDWQKGSNIRGASRAEENGKTDSCRGFRGLRVDKQLTRNSHSA